MPLIETKGAASAQGFGLTLSSGAVPYIEDVFSTYLYTGNGSTQTITNGIDLSTKGGLVWAKDRNAANSNTLYDTVRGVRKTLYSNTNGAQVTEATDEGVYAFGTTGFSIGGGANTSNGSGNNIVSWTFRKQPKFFDIVTYTGNGVAGRTVSHSLGAVPGCMIIKRTSSAGSWIVYHRSLGNTIAMELQTTGGAFTDTVWNNTTPTSTVFTLGGESIGTNDSGSTYVAYLFAHNAGGFGLSGTDNVISCGSFTTNGSGNATVSLGYEPQFVLFKGASGANANGDPWGIGDVMRGLTQTNIARLIPNLSNAEDNITSYVPTPTATGFDAKGFAGSTTYIYIAIRRGPMKVPTSGTSVFSPISATTVSGVQTTGFPLDLQLARKRAVPYNDSWVAIDRLRGISTSSASLSAQRLVTSNTGAESIETNLSNSWSNTGFTSPGEFGGTGDAPVFYSFRRAPSFFDVVCYTGTGSNTTQTHNLGVVPEMMIVKQRTAVTGATIWAVYHSTLGAGQAIRLNSNVGPITDNAYWNGTTPTASVFSLGNQQATNVSTGTYVAYLFATVAGVSKVGSYTGTGALQTIDCGFTGGARFVLIKRTDDVGDWYVWDSARGIVAGNDPYLLLNSTAAEVTNTDYVDTYSAGFEISSTAPAAINANGGTYIFLAIA